MSVGIVDKQTGDRIPTAGMPAIDNALSATSTNPVQNAIITAALANKQDKTDNNLQTTDKTVVGAINEHEGDIGSLKSGFTNLDNEVNGDATVYPYADVITIEDAVPSNLADCSVKIEPVQSGSGDPSPTNIRPIIGHTEVDVQRDGRNLWGLATSYTSTSSGDWVLGDGSLNLKSGTYTMSVSDSTNLQNTQVYIKKGNAVLTNFILKSNEGRVSKTFTISEDSDGVAICMYGNARTIFDIQLELGSTATPYEPYAGKTYTIALGDTIYGGTVDFDSGVMTVDRALIEYDGSNDETWYDNKIEDGYSTPRPAGLIDSICDKFKNAGGRTTIQGEYWAGGSNLNFVCSEIITSLTDWKTYLANNPLQICYQFSTPTTIQLTPQQIQLLKGTNTITASTGQISVTVNGVSGAIGAVQTAVNNISEQLPTAPTTDGAYVLTVTVADGVPSYSWVSGS